MNDAQAARELMAAVREITASRSRKAVDWMVSYQKSRDKAQARLFDALRKLGYKTVYDLLLDDSGEITSRDVQPVKDALIAVSEACKAIERQAKHEDATIEDFNKELKKKWPRF